MSDDREHERWVIERKEHLMERAHDRLDAFTDAANAGAMAMGPAALKTSILINGGAALAILTFISAIIGETEVNPDNISSAANSLIWFAIGVAVGAAGLGLAYLTTYCQAAESTSVNRIADPPFEAPTSSTGRWRIAAGTFQVSAVVCGIASILAFVVGMIAVRGAIVQLLTPI